MTNLSLGADMAWRISAHEAVASGYRYIEKEHFFRLEYQSLLSYERNIIISGIISRTYAS